MNEPTCNHSPHVLCDVCDEQETRDELAQLREERRELGMRDPLLPDVLAARERTDRAIARLEALMEIDYQQMTQLARALNLISDPFRPVTA